MTEVERHSYDVVVIGAGGAGLRAVIEARERGLKVAVVSKSLFGKAHTVMAEGGCAASMGNTNPKDNWQTHFGDTMRGGKFLNNWRMAELHAKEAPDRVWELETYGALFDRLKDGKISQRNFGGHTYPRLAHVGDRTGLELIRTMQQKIVSLQQEDFAELGDYEARIKVFAECTITELLKDGDKIAGAFGYWRDSGGFVVFEAPAVVLATGGIGTCVPILPMGGTDAGAGDVARAESDAVVGNPGDLDPEPLQDRDLGLGIADPRHPVQQQLLLRQQAGGEDRQSRVLVAGDGQLSGERGAALDDEFLHSPARVTTAMGRGWKIAIGVVTALVVVLAVNAFAVNGETKSAAVTVPGGRILDLPGGKLQVLERGPRDGSPIVLIHCYTCGIDWWLSSTTRRKSSGK